MSKTTEPIRCMFCGRFISYEDLMTGKAQNIMATPDSHQSVETWESYHHECRDAWNRQVQRDAAGGE